MRLRKRHKTRPNKTKQHKTNTQTKTPTKLSNDSYQQINIKMCMDTTPLNANIQHLIKK